MTQEACPFRGEHFTEHQDQGKKCAKYLRGKAPLKCVFSHQVNSRAEALQIEHQIKKLSKSQKYALIREKIYFSQP